MKLILALGLLTFSTLSFANDNDPTIEELKALPKTAVYQLSLTDAKPHAYAVYNFGKAPIGSKTVVEYQITNNTSSPLEFIRGIRASKNHIKGDHTCNNGPIAVGAGCTLYFYHVPKRWGTHSGKGIIEFSQYRTVTMQGYGKGIFN